MFVLQVVNLHEGNVLEVRRELHVRRITALLFFNPLKYLVTAAKDGSSKTIVLRHCFNESSNDELVVNSLPRPSPPHQTTEFALSSSPLPSFVKLQNEHNDFLVGHPDH